MKNLKTTMSLMALICLIVLTAFKPKNPDYHKLPKALRDQYRFISGGKFYIGNDTLEGTAFYMSSTEVTNADYRGFLEYVKANQDKETNEKIEIDTTVWHTVESNNFNTLANYYFTHPAYNSYPVVGISLEGAKAYCDYLEEVLNKDPNNKFTYTVSLPTRAQWIQAASIANHNSVYAWQGQYLRNKDGAYLCNFYHINAERIHRNGQGELVYEMPDTNAINAVHKSQLDVTSPVLSYWPSSAGLYNMNGNAAELTIDGLVCGGSWNDPGYDVRNESYIKYVQPTNTIGFRPILKVTPKQK